MKHHLQSIRVIGLLMLIFVFAAPLATQEDSLVNCKVSTDQTRTVRVRVGFGENRTALAFLTVGTEFEVLGQNVDENEAVWYALDKEQVAPGKSIQGRFAWVAAAEVETTGDCLAVPILAASAIVPYPGTFPPGVSLIIISNEASWVNSGITITAGQSFTIEAEGRMNPCLDTYPNGANYCVFYGPEGADWLVTQNNEFGVFPALEQPFMGLLGRVGHDRPFYVGVGGTFTAQETGTLRFTPNDNRRTDNRGTYRVLVWIEEVESSQ